MKSLAHDKGFTLIELVLVIVIIGILSGIIVSVINPEKMKQKSRDARRVSDLSRIQNALENYFSEKKVYPTNTANPNVEWSLIANSLCATTADYLTAKLTPNYINVMPVDPLFNKNTTCNNNGSCQNGDLKRYNYASKTGGKYVLTAMFEDPNNLPDDKKCLNVPNFNDSVNVQDNCNLNSGLANFTTSSFCYAVSSPN